MRLLNLLRHREIADLEVGELVLRTIGRSPGPALVIDRSSQGVTFGVLRHPELTRPISYLVQSGSSLSFGTSWALEILPASLSPPTRHYQETTQPGDLLIGKEGTMVVLDDSHAKPAAPFGFNVDTLALVALPEEAARCAGWRIWAHKDDWRRPSATPVFEWVAPSPTAAIVS
ncbi:hypothetical protein Rumeso_02646 [Rubellimicrobium mesophilum DSM 19309]|uniref:Uncharacterized protein n=1 Tax=Rubellimicrobium mesophilum DSM 19309 TaxID=442562 RepID=A0A017HQ16_9RHOB|nr:hypothetical protein [Rubellimicrobium mesophilum]EYD75864.1 hypothetical protein Rumeso_02646 [Rubellimicrobium mesophilum DSM 19309]